MSTKGIAKYYIGLGVLMLFVIVTLIYTVSQAGAAKTDRETNKTVEQISTKLEVKIAENGQVPTSLQAAGVTNPASTVDYKKLSDSKYKICIDYKAASNGFDAGWFSLLGGAFSTPSQYESDHTYFDSTVEFNHKKGQNCQTITSNSTFTSNPYYGGGSTGGGVYTNCDTYSNTYPGRRTAKIQSVDMAKKTIYLDASYTQNFQDSSGYQSTTNLTSLTYSDATTFYDQDCQKIKASDLVAGERADFYVTSMNDSFTGQVEVVASGLNTITQ